jgi:hypothetical protein
VAFEADRAGFRSNCNLALELLDEGRRVDGASRIVEFLDDLAAFGLG